MEDKKRLKILIVSQYFWPENFRVNDLVNYFKSVNAEVEILTGKPNYPGGKLYKEFNKNPRKFDSYCGYKINRVPMIVRGNGSNTSLFFNYLSFLVSSMFFGLFIFRKKKFDYIFTFGTSPLTVAFTSIVLAKLCKSKTILWVLDLWPEIIFELGVLKNKFLEIFLSKIVKYIFNKTDVILAQSEKYVDLIKDKINDKNKVFYLPSWPEKSDEFNQKQTNELNLNSINKKNLNIFFTGSVGDAQNFKTVADIIFKTKNRFINWYIIGGGRRFKELVKLKRIMNLDNLELLDFQSPNEIIRYQKKADILFLSLKKGKVLSSTIPGKFSTYLKFNKPILGLISGEVKNLINDYNVGKAFEPEEINEFINELERLYLLKKDGILDLEFKNHNKLLDKFDYELNLKNLHRILIDQIKLNDKSFDKIKLVETVNKELFEKNFILSGLNLAFLGHYVSSEIKIHQNMYNWPDGIFKFLFFKSLYKKIPGRDLLNDLKIPENIKIIRVLGFLSKKSENYLADKFKKKIIHSDLPFGSLEKIKKSVPLLGNDELCLLTLPTPKQEQIADYIAKNQSNYKILCIGGAINMLTGEEAPCPKILENYGLEAIWRLRTDTGRRASRLAKSLLLFTYGLITGKFKNIKGKINY